MSLRIINRSIVPTLAEVDILVVGAGSAGCVAALAARKSKAHFVWDPTPHTHFQGSV